MEGCDRAANKGAAPGGRLNRHPPVPGSVAVFCGPDFSLIFLLETAAMSRKASPTSAVHFLSIVA